jgi:signal transduction histidine kinase
VQMDLMLHRFLDIHNVKHMAHESETVNLRFEIDEILNSMHNLENYPRIHFRIEVPGDLSITAGKHLVRIMLRNIIENAVVFARKDWKIVPRIRIRAFREGETVRMNITDNGIGIAQEVAPHIFNMFYRGTTTSSGLGLGLYAASVAAGLIGAQLRLVKDNTSETEFEILIPLRPVRPLQHISPPVSV